MITKSLYALVVAVMVLSIQACDDNNGGGGSDVRALMCGDTISESDLRSISTTSRETIAGDDVLNCSGTALTVEGPAVLDLGSHTVSCDGSEGSIGILLTGEGAILKNGNVTNCESGVYVDGDGDHTIREIDSSENVGDRDVPLAGGFVIVSDGNTLTNVSASGNEPVGVQLVGDNNVVSKSDISENDHAGLAIFGNSNIVSDTETDDNHYANIFIASVIEQVDTGNGKNNVLSDVSASGSEAFHGIYLDGDSNTVSASDALDNYTSGIVVGENGDDNAVIDNTALDNDIASEEGFDLDAADLADFNTECNTIWLDNIFGTEISSCI